MGLLDIFDSEQGRLGLAMLAAAGPQARPMGFGERMSMALGYRDQFRDSAEKKRLQEEDTQWRRTARDRQQTEWKREDAKFDLERQERERALALKQAIPGLFRSQATQGEVSTPEIGGVPMFSAGSKVTQPSMVGPRKFDIQAALELGMPVAQIKEYAGLSDFGRPEVARTVEEDDGRGGKVTVQLDKFGQRVGSPLPGYVAPVQVNQGDRVTFTRPQAGVSLPVGMSPAERDASARGWASNRLAQERLDYDRSPAGKAPSGYRWSADGTRLEAIQGGPADKDAAATEGERKAATLLTRIEAAQAKIDDLTKSNPGASTPSIASFLPGETFRNLANPESRQRIEAAQLDFLDAALTLGTGAAYTREQLEGYRKSYFPQIGDSPKTIQDKLDRQQQLIQAARLSAGRAKSAFSPAGAPPVGTVQNGYRFKGGNPADPSSWEMAR